MLHFNLIEPFKPRPAPTPIAVATVDQRYVTYGSWTIAAVIFCLIVLHYLSQ